MYKTRAQLNVHKHLILVQLNSLHVQSALVCRYCQQQAEKSICFVCQTTENLWICVICGFVDCERYKGGDAIIHWKETQHCYSLEVETKRVWDYVGDNYVHRLIQSKTDGKLVELNSHCVHADKGCGSCSFEDNAMIERLYLMIVNEYNELLATQLDNQKLYFESLLQEVEEETERETSKVVEKAVSLKQQKIQAKINRCNKEKKFLDDLSCNPCSRISFAEYLDNLAYDHGTIP